MNAGTSVMRFDARSWPAEQLDAIGKSIEQSITALDLLLGGDMDKALMKIHAKPPRPKPPPKEPDPS